MENNPQLVFENLFGDGTTDAQRRERRNQASSLLDSLGNEVSLSKSLSAADRSILSDYLEERCAKLNAASISLTKNFLSILNYLMPRWGFRGFENHLNLMFDLQLLSFKTEITRISTLMLARENSNTSYPGSGVREGFHNASHHSNERANKTVCPHQYLPRWALAELPRKDGQYS